MKNNLKMQLAVYNSNNALNDKDAHQQNGGKCSKHTMLILLQMMNHRATKKQWKAKMQMNGKQQWMQNTSHSWTIKLGHFAPFLNIEMQ